jgi:hypothetical protein
LWALKSPRTACEDSNRHQPGQRLPSVARQLAETRAKLDARAKERFEREMAEHRAKLAARDEKTERHRGKLATVIDQIKHDHHVFRAYKNAILKQYEKFSTFLRHEPAQTTSATLVSRKAWTISMQSARRSKP